MPSQKTLFLFLSSFLISCLFLFPAFSLASMCPPPVISVATQGLHVDINWTSVKNATGYNFIYAPFPYTGEKSIQTADMGSQTSFSADLWEGAAYYVAVQAYDSQGCSDYSNIEIVNIQVAPEIAHNRNTEYLDSYLTKMLSGDVKYEYGIYAARLISNPNIHLYLKADQYFVSDISKLTGSETLFLTPVSENCTTYESQIQNDGDPSNDGSFNFDLVDLNEYEVVADSAIYPEGYPYLPWFDRRVQPITATLKASEVTSLEKAFLAYFKYKHENYGDIDAVTNDLCIIATDSGVAFLSDGTTFLDTSLTIVSLQDVLAEKPVLIFNQEETWFPLLEQTTVDESGSVAKVLSSLDLHGTEIPSLFWMEEPLIDKLKQMHTVDEMPNEALNLALEAASTVFQEVNGGGEELQSIANKYPVHDFNFQQHRFLLTNEIPVFASFLSPIADYMAKFYQSHDAYDFSAEFHKNNTHSGCGELWGQNYNIYTIDQGWRFDTGVCLNLANYAAAIVELAGEHWFKIGIIGHLYTFSADSGRIINNGYLRESNGSAFYEDFINLDGWHSVQDISGSASFALGYNEERQLDMSRYFEQRTLSKEQGYAMFEYLYDLSEQKPSLGIEPSICVQGNCNGGKIEWFEGWSYINQVWVGNDINYFDYFEYPQFSNGNQ